MKLKSKAANDIMLIVVGTILMAVGFYFLMMPNGFVLGGVGGLGIILGGSPRSASAPGSRASTCCFSS